MNPRLRIGLGWGIASVVTLSVAIVIAGPAPASQPRGRTITFLDPLDEPVTIHLAGETVTVPSRGRSSARIPLGATDVVVQGAGGRVLDRHRQEIPDGGGMAVYGVLGAAPMYRAQITYTNRSYPEDRTPPPPAQPIVGERLNLLHGDYLFVQPPEQITMSSNEVHVTRTHVDVAEGGWETALSMAFEVNERYPEACALARRLHRVYPAAWGPLSLAVDCTTRLDGPAAAVTVADEALAAAPDALSAHRSWAHAMRVAGRLREARERYQRLAAEKPASPLAAAMRLRTGERDGAEAQALAAAARFPSDRDVLRMAGLVLSAAGNHRQAATVLGRIPLGSAAENGHLEALVRALARTDRAQEAASRALDGANVRDADARDVALYLRALRLPGLQSVAPRALLARWSHDQPAAVAWARALAGELEPGDADQVQASANDRTTMQIVAWATRDPARALDQYQAAAPGARMQVPEEVQQLLALEAYRVGDRELFRDLARSLAVSAAEAAAWIDRGVEPEEAWRFDDDDRAAFALVRTRRLEAAGEPVPPELAARTRADPLPGPAAQAAQRWPAPARGSNAIRFARQP